MRFPKSGPIVLLNYCSRRYRAWATKVPILFSCKTEALNPGPQTPPPPPPPPLLSWDEWVPNLLDNRSDPATDLFEIFSIFEIHLYRIRRIPEP